MDSITRKDNSPDAIRERIESKRDEFAGGSEPGWQTLEATVEDTRHEAAQEWSQEGGTSTAESSQVSTPEVETTYKSAEQPVSTLGESGDVVVTQRTSQSTDTSTESPPFNDEHPLGVGQQCFKCGAYNELEAATCWNCSSDLTHSMIETPGVVQSVLPTADDEAMQEIPSSGVNDQSGGARPISSDAD